MTRRRRHRLGPKPTVPPGPHLLLGWQTGPRTVAAWCGLCLAWHLHGRPTGEGWLLHRVAHCSCRPSLDSYYVLVVGPMSPTARRLVRRVWGRQLAHRAALVRQRGGCPGRQAWPTFWVRPTPWRKRR